MSKLNNATLLQPEESVTTENFAAEAKVLASQRVGNHLNRRSFMASAGAIGVLTASGCGNGNQPTTGPVNPPQTQLTEADVLNYALNLEYLEASFYLYIATGSGLPASLTGASPGAVTGASPLVPFTDPNVAALAQQLANDELAHVQFLRSIITAANATPVDMPALNLAALGAITNDATFLAIARQLETVGTSAYEGGVQFFVSDLTGLAYAATIHDAEGQHEGTLRQFCIAKGIVSAAVDANDKPPSISAVFNTNANGLNTLRTPSQVLQIVYAAPGQTGVSSGGFYPSGMNGNIHIT